MNAPARHGFAAAFARAGMPLVLLVLFAGLGGSVALTYRTALGQLVWAYLIGARTELRKVVWPTREETIQTTLVVLVLALICGEFFWLLDLFLLFLTSRITGQGGL